MPDIFAAENKLLAAFLSGARPPHLTDTLLISYRPDGADLHGLYRTGLMARRLEPARQRRSGLVWINPRDRHIGWRLDEAARSAGLRVLTVATRALPVDAAEARRWRKWELDANELIVTLRRRGCTTFAGVTAPPRTPRREVSEALRRHPRLLERHPTGFWRGRAETGGTALRHETWVTPEGLDLAQAASTLAQGQGLTWGEALDLVAGPG